MRQETFAILFLMRKGRPKKNGLAPIFARITTGGLRQEVYTQCDSNPETWNQHKERAMGTNKLAIQVNERLNDFRVKIIDIRSKLLAEGYAANAAQIKQRYRNPTCNTMMLIAGLTDYVKRRQAEVGVPEGRAASAGGTRIRLRPEPPDEDDGPVLTELPGRRRLPHGLSGRRLEPSPAPSRRGDPDAGLPLLHGRDHRWDPRQDASRRSAAVACEQAGTCGRTIRGGGGAV